MAAPPTTPRKQESATPFQTPQTTRVASSHIIHSSPHYTTTRRHSLYGTEDRVILDPGSRVWKVGFSGEGKPRDVFSAGGGASGALWTLSRALNLEEREEEDKLLEARLQTCLRSVFHDSLLTDPKSRKVIVTEHPLLPLHIKEMLARILFNNLQVPSISFASSHLLALLAAGRVTGLVLDCGHLESTALPIYSSRPLFPQLSTSPLAGSRLSSHLRALLLLFGTYHPPPQNLNTNAPTPAASRATRVPQGVLTDAVIEDLKARCCFVGEALGSDIRSAYPMNYGSETASQAPFSDSGRSESSFEHVSAEFQSNASQPEAPPSSDFSMVSQSTALSTFDRPKLGETHLQALANLYQRHSTASDLHIRVEPLQNTGTGRGTLVVPGWIRERAAEVLFEGGDVDESSVAEVILDSLLKVPVDLRKSLASSILVTGGTPMLPGFIPRLHAELVKALSQQPEADAIARPRGRSGRPSLKPGPFDRYATLRSLAPHIAVLNHPAPPPASSSRAVANAGKAPAFTPACMAWVGGSLAGALKTGGTEVPREKWDEADAQADPEDGVAMSPLSPRSARTILPDWTRSPLPAGAPPAKAPTLSVPPPAVDATMTSPTQAVSA